jgi:hypothetical protein
MLQLLFLNFNTYKSYEFLLNNNITKIERNSPIVMVSIRLFILTNRIQNNTVNVIYHFDRLHH